MSNEQTEMTVERAADVVIQQLQENIAKQLELFAKGTEAINKLSLATQRNSITRMVVGVAMRQRITLLKEMKLAEETQDPVCTALAQQQLDDNADEIIDILNDVGIESSKARKALEAAQNLVSIEVVKRNNKNGTIEAITRVPAVN